MVAAKMTVAEYDGKMPIRGETIKKRRGNLPRYTPVLLQRGAGGAPPTPLS